MKVKELIDYLQTLEQDTEIMISVRKGWRPIGDLKQILTEEISPCFEQDTGEVRYMIGVDISDPIEK